MELHVIFDNLEVAFAVGNERRTEDVAPLEHGLHGTFQLGELDPGHVPRPLVYITSITSKRSSQ